MLVLLTGLSTIEAQTDPGILWQPLYEPGSGGCIVSLAVNPHDPKHLISGGDMLGVATSFDGGDSWQSTFGFSSYEMATPTFHPTDPNIVWIGSATGPYVSHDLGIHWQWRRKGMPATSDGRYTAMVEKVVFDPDQPGRLLAFGGTSRRWQKADTFGWVWESTDDGENWKHLTTLTDAGSTNDAITGGNVVWVDYEPGSTTILHALLDGGYWLTSADDGRTWRRRQPKGLTAALDHIRFEPANPRIVWASVGNHVDGSAQRQPGGVYRSDDAGETFVRSDQGIRKVQGPVENINLSSRFSQVAISAADPKVLWVCDLAWNAGVIYKSEDAGATWRAMASRDPIGMAQETGVLSTFKPRTATPAGISLQLTEDPTSSLRIYGYSSEFILRSIDGGITWDDATAFNPFTDQPDVWRGRGWNGWCSNEVRFNPYKTDQLVVQAMDAGRAWISEDRGYSWRYANTDTHPWLGGNAITFTKDGHIYGTTGQFDMVNGITRSRDGGKNWQSLAGQERGLPGKGWGAKGNMSGIHAHPEKSNLVWAVVNGQLLHSTDHGENWKPLLDQAVFHWIEPDPTNMDRFYVSGRDGIYVCDDGKTLVNLGGPRPANRAKLHVDHRGRLYACQWRTGRTGVWRYTPESKKWERLLDEHQAFDVSTDPSNPTRIVMVTTMDPFHDYAGGNGVWISHDDGKTWSPANDGLAMRRANCVTFDPAKPTRMILGTYGRGFFEAHWPKEYRPQGERQYTPNQEDDIHAAVTASVGDRPTIRIVNGTMTDGEAIPSGWENQWVGRGQIKVSRDTTTFKQGPSSLRVETLGEAMGQASQMLDGQPGDQIRVTGFVKSTGQVKVNFAVQSYNDQWSPIGFDQVGFVLNESDWTRFSKLVTLPTATARFAIVLLVEGTGKAWLDEVNLQSVAATSDNTATVGK